MRQDAVAALGILNAKGGAVVVTEIELGKVAVKVLFLAVLVHPAAQAAFEHRKHVLGGVRMHVAPNVLAGGVLDGVVVREADL